MGKVLVTGTVSLDGFIADENDAVGPLFDWYGNATSPSRWAIRIVRSM